LVGMIYVTGQSFKSSVVVVSGWSAETHRQSIATARVRLNTETISGAMLRYLIIPFERAFILNKPINVNTEVKVHRTAEQKYISLKVDGPGELVSGRGSARGITPSLLRRSNLVNRAES
jgi:hypothetical protein